MKKIAKFLIVLGMMGQLSSCDYLDIVPDERAQESDPWKTEGAVRGYLYSCYGYLPANRTFGNSYWLAEELTAVTKELFTTFKYGYYSPVSLGFTSNTWSTIWNGIHQCYMFQESLKQVSNEYVTDEMKKQYLAESNFLIAYYHFLSMRSYGPTMIIRSVIDLETPISGFPERSSIDEVVAFINEKLDEAMSEGGLPTTWSGKDYGRATRLAALALKSRVYLYAASPLYNGNTEMYADFRSPLDGRQLIAQEKSQAKWEISATQTKYAIDEVEKAMEHYQFSVALEAIWKLIRRSNKYVDETEPWKLAKDDDKLDRLNTVLYNLAESLRIVSVLIYPFIKDTSLKIREQLGVSGEINWEDARTFGLIEDGTKVNKGEVIFPRLDIEAEIDRFNEENTALLNSRVMAEAHQDKEAVEDIKKEINIEDFAKLDIRVAEIVGVEDHPNADKLYVLKLKIGDMDRQIVSGIKEYYKKNELIGKKILMILNLKPIKLRGVESNGMLLAAEDDEGNLSLASTLADVKSGAKIS